MINCELIMILLKHMWSHEVTRPVAVAGAEVGDAIAIRIKDITVTSLATSSGNDRFMEGRFLGDPYVAGRCPECNTLYPELAAGCGVLTTKDKLKN